MFDLTDFFLGAGWIILLPIAWAIFSRRLNWLLIACLAMPLLVAIGGLLQSETARVWAFMLPLLALPAAVQLRRVAPLQRAIIFIAMLLVALAAGQNLIFTAP